MAVSTKPLVDKGMTQVFTHLGKSMTFTLKGFKHSKFASQETECYQTDVLIDGELAFRAINSGQGGPDMYVTYGPNYNRGLLEKAQEFCKTLPSTQSGDYIFDSDLELVMQDMITHILTKGDENKALNKILKKSKTNAILRLSTDKSGSYRTSPIPYSEEMASTIRLRNPQGVSFLNEELSKNPDFDVLNWVGYFR